jgi:DMSO reductase family type II enzyme heme b subunit
MNALPYSALAVAALFAALPAAQAIEPTTITAVRLDAAPMVDGDLKEWGDDGWTAIPVAPAVEDDPQNTTGRLEVRLKAAVAGDTLFIAARWPDDTPDTEYKPWLWQRNKYVRGKERDDMFAVRFHMSGTYDTCMLTDKTYTVDVWLWSAGRSNARGYADDMTHLVTTEQQDEAAEHEFKPGRMVYIRKQRDAGTPIYVYTRPERDKFKGERLPGVAYDEPPSGSVADVQAKGTWRNGHWHLEMARRLDTGQADDVILKAGTRIPGAVAVFNKGESEHKSVSGDLLFVLPP